jgi:anaerobic selenocysteine-containing dehydrogenase
MESPPVVLNMNGDTDYTEELFEQMCSTSRIPLDQVRSHRTANLRRRRSGRGTTPTTASDIGNDYMLPITADVGRGFSSARSDSAFPFQLIPRRHSNFMNSSGTNLAALNRGKAYNPAYMHPDTIAALGLQSGALATITSPHDGIPVVLGRRHVAFRRHHATIPVAYPPKTPRSATAETMSAVDPPTWTTTPSGMPRQATSVSVTPGFEAGSTAARRVSLRIRARRSCHR